jgi:hypothetical protein
MKKIYKVNDSNAAEILKGVLEDDHNIFKKILLKVELEQAGLIKEECIVNVINKTPEKMLNGKYATVIFFCTKKNSDDSYTVYDATKRISYDLTVNKVLLRLYTEFNDDVWVKLPIDYIIVSDNDILLYRTDKKLEEIEK